MVRAAIAIARNAISARCAWGWGAWLGLGTERAVRLRGGWDGGGGREQEAGGQGGEEAGKCQGDLWACEPGGTR